MFFNLCWTCDPMTYAGPLALLNSCPCDTGLPFRLWKHLPRRLDDSPSTRCALAFTSPTAALSWSHLPRVLHSSIWVLIANYLNSSFLSSWWKEETSGASEDWFLQSWLWERHWAPVLNTVCFTQPVVELVFFLRSKKRWFSLLQYQEPMWGSSQSPGTSTLEDLIPSSRLLRLFTRGHKPTNRHTHIHN